MVRKQSQSPYVVGTSTQSKEPRSYRDYFGRLLKRLDIPHLVFHQARHSFATLICLSNGVPIETISKMMGHYSIRTTQIYAEITNHKVSRDLETLSENTKGKYALPDDGMPSRVFKCGNYSGWKKECASNDETKIK